VPKSRKRRDKHTGKPVSYKLPYNHPDTLIRQDMLNERAKNRQWRLDPTAGRKPPPWIYIYDEDKSDDAPRTRTERRFAKTIFRDGGS
jgi:hypothetical protein